MQTWQKWQQMIVEGRLLAKHKTGQQKVHMEKQGTADAAADQAWIPKHLSDQNVNHIGKRQSR